MFGFRNSENERMMHQEEFEITKKSANIINGCKGRLICVGTTSLRAIESAAHKGKIMLGKRKTKVVNTLTGSPR